MLILIAGTLITSVLDDNLLSKEATSSTLSAYHSLLAHLFRDSKDNTVGSSSLILATTRMPMLVNDDLKRDIWLLLAPHWTKALMQVRDDPELEQHKIVYLAMLPNSTRTPSMIQAERFVEVLTAAAVDAKSSSSSSSSSTWSIIQTIASKLIPEDQQAFFDWSVQPLISNLHNLRDDPTFISQWVATVQKQLTDSCLAMDAVSSALYTGVSGLEKHDMPTLLALLPVLPAFIEGKSPRARRMYALVLAKFRSSYSSSLVGSPPRLAEIAAVFVKGLPVVEAEEISAEDRMACRNFAHCWNETYGSSIEALEYSEELKKAIMRLHEGDVFRDGLRLNLPGWPEVGFFDSFLTVSSYLGTSDELCIICSH